MISRLTGARCISVPTSPLLGADRGEYELMTSTATIKFAMAQSTVRLVGHSVIRTRTDSGY
jgi:hypothetical protein